MADYAESLVLEIVSDSAPICFKSRIESKLVEYGLLEDYRKFGSNDTGSQRWVSPQSHLRHSANRSRSDFYNAAATSSS